MTVYRANRRIRSRSRGIIEEGQRTRLEWLSPGEIQILMQKGVIRREESPKLEELAGWKTRGRRLKALDVNTAEDFLDADPDWMAEQLHVKPETVEKWSKELSSWFEAPPAKRG
jgi:hypothetical protein